MYYKLTPLHTEKIVSENDTNILQANSSTKLQMCKVKNKVEKFWKGA